jgi:glucose/arabinose dehydrogenase
MVSLGTLLDRTDRVPQTFLRRVLMVLHRWAVVLVAVLVAGGCGRPQVAPGAAAETLVPEPPPTQITRLPACDADNGGLTLPDGFCALVAHQGVGAARHIAVAPNGDVYVALRDQQNQRGGVVGLRDTNGDGRLDETARFGPEGGTGIAVHQGYLYFAPNTYVVRWPLSSRGLEPEGPMDTVVHGFPEQRSHAAKTLAFDDRGSLWVNVGAPSNNCGVNDRQRGARGQEPCPELERQAGVWRFDANRTRQHQRDGERYASGLRNMLAIAWHPAAGALFGVQHGRDQMDVVAPEHFTPERNAHLPSEEFHRIDRGMTGAWPYCYHDPQQNRYVLAPEYGGDGRRVGQCDRFPAPLAAYPAHWAPQELHFYTGEHFPARFRGGAFVAWHGSWNRAPEPQRGFKVTFQPMVNGRPTGAFEVFADGFAGRDVIPSPAEARHRPMGLAQAPDGTLYIVDSREGRIWRVVYRGR